jgi:hypothetical protein
MNPHATRFKRVFLMLSVTLTLSVGGISTLEVHKANAGANDRCNIIVDDIDYARCIGLPLPQ